MIKQDSENKAKTLARAVIALDKPPLHEHETPDDEEIQRWVKGQLSRKRAEQLTLCALQDPLLMQRFRDMQNQSEPDNLKSSLVAVKNRFEDTAYDLLYGIRERIAGLASGGSLIGHTGGGLVAASLVVGFFVFQIVDINAPPRQAWQDDFVIKSSLDSPGLEELTIERIALLRGIEDVRPEFVTVASLQPDKANLADCDETDRQCRERLAAFRSIGQLAVTTDQSCRSGTPTDVTTAVQLQDAIDKLAGHASAQPFLGPLERWRDSTKKQRFCASVAEFIERAIRFEQ